MAHYSIKDLEKLSGIKAHTLRIWEKRYNLLEPKRTNTNIRFYDDEDLKRILNIALLNRNGIKISHIADLDDTEISGRISDLARSHPETTNQIDNLVMSMIELDEKKFEKVLAKSTQMYGFEDTVLHLIYPFFEKIGILWQTGVVNPAQEHFVSNLIRQKLIVAIDKLPESEKTDSQRFIMYLPEGELHEIGLLFYYFLAKKRGQTVVTSFSSSFSGIDINEYLSQLSHAFPKQKVFFSTFDYSSISTQLPDNVIYVKNAFHFSEIIKRLL